MLVRSFHQRKYDAGILSGFRHAFTRLHPLHTQACLNYHGKNMVELKGMNWEGSLHEARCMTRVYCHQRYVSSDKMKDAQQ